MFSVATSSRSVLRTALRGAQVLSTRLESTRFYSSTMHENDPEVLEREKFRNLSKVQRKYSPNEDAPGWNEKLASASEAAVKADRSSGSAEELVSNTLQRMRATREETENNGANTTAPYSRDEVSGPLKGVGKEEANIERRIEAEEANRAPEGLKQKEVKTTRGAKSKGKKPDA